MRRFLSGIACAAIVAAGLAGARATGSPDAKSLALARQQAEQAAQRSTQLERQAERATSEAERARAEAEALAARIQAAEAELTAAETRIAMIERQRAAQRVRLAERQGPVIRLTAALQTLARRPPALALVQPGSVDDAIHVRALLAATLPEIRRRTAALRTEVARSEALRRQSEQARQALAESREALRQRRTALARFEAEQRTRSENLAGLALAESDRALAFGEEARALARLIGTREFQARLESSLAELPGPTPRPGTRQNPPGARRGGPSYSLPVDGRVVTGVGEISDAGVHARGLTLAAEPEAPVVAPADGRVIYAAPFRSYGQVVILDHGRGWSTVITDLATLNVRPGQRVGRGTILGRVGGDRPEVTVELRRAGRPMPVTQFVSR